MCVYVSPRQDNEYMSASCMPSESMNSNFYCTEEKDIGHFMFHFMLNYLYILKMVSYDHSYLLIS